MPPPRKSKTLPKGKQRTPSLKSGHSKPAQAKPRRAESRKVKKSLSPPRSIGMPWDKLSPEHRLDLVGGIMALVGLATLLILLSPQKSSLPGLWVSLLYQVAGWGMFILPLALIVFGLWLIFRKIERLPRITLERFCGLALLYLVFLATLHLGGGRGLALAQKGEGGGHIGAFIEGLLTGGLGIAGAVVVLIALGIIALIMAFDVSIVDVSNFILRIGSHWQANRRQKAIDRELEQGSEELPPEFEPIISTPAASNSTASPVSRTKLPFQPSTPVSRKTSGSMEQKPGQGEGQVVNAGVSPAPVWVLPRLDEILDPVTPVAVQTNVDHDRAKVIEETLASFGAPAHIVEIHRGPTVTQFGVEPDFVDSRSGRTRVRVARIVALADDLALALAAPRIRIQAPVPGRSFVGIEVPNTEISRVTLREVLESDAFQKLRSNLRFALGKDVSGKSMAYDLTSMPHLLIAGTTGSGKSVCVNSILCCLLMNNTPQEMRLVLVDPKRVELTGYNGVPHLLGPVVVDAERVIGALQWMLREMDSRYHKFAATGTRNIQEYNNKRIADKLAYLVVVVDELADLMMLAPDETERCITRLAQLARATGIHLILATQRPSVNVVTGLIKANFPARIAFAVASGVDSRVILDQPGAERLLGRGDMLFQAPDASAPVRLQGVYVSDTETQRLVDYWRFMSAKLMPTSPSDGELIESLPNGVPLKQIPLWEEKQAEPEDPLLNEAVELVRREGRASVTMLQRRMRIGYTRAARLVDVMETRKIIGPSLPNSQVREVLDYGSMAPPEED
jgi:S-DNA-T family DNA segregation ATPase FtsK/SpoIIIE